MVIYKNPHEFLMTVFYVNKNLLVTQHKIDQSCALFSKAQVCQRLLMIPNAAFPFSPLSTGVATIAAAGR